jgi:Carboxypeptidase regulatory-like domain
MPGCNPITSCLLFLRRGHLARVAGPALLAIACSLLAFAQDEPGQDSPPRPSGTEPVSISSGSGELSPLTNVPRASVHGVVKNAATGEPLPRALVRIEGDAVAGALTDGEGRFEIGDVPLGPQALQVMKPGFIDSASLGMGPPTVVNGSSNSEHNVYVASGMPDLAFSLAPTNAISGQVALSTGDPAQGIAVMLLRRSVQDGRAIWQPVTNVRSNSDGAYRFAGLTDGTYAVFTEPSMDSEIASGLVESAGAQAVTRAGFPSVFYPDAPDLAGAAKIQVAAGEQAQANLLLPETPFHLVRAVLVLPRAGSATASAPLNVDVSVLDGQGHQLPYGGQYDAGTNSVQAFLPDGSYTLQVTTMGVPSLFHYGGRRVPNISSGRTDDNNSPDGPFIGRAEFSVAGHAVTHLQIPLSAQRGNTIQVSLIRSGISRQQESAGGQQAPIVVMLSQAGGTINDGMVSSFAEGYANGPMETNSSTSPGSYWVHTSIQQKTLCEASFTAGGASLAREPLVLSLSGASAPLMLTLRDDCASLRISLPERSDVQGASEEPYYTIYVVPDFDSTTDITPLVLRPSSGGSLTLDGLTPGSYHVYTFSSAVQLEYHNPEATAAFSNLAQAVTLAPGGSSSLVVEVPGH